MFIMYYDHSRINNNKVGFVCMRVLYCFYFYSKRDTKGARKFFLAFEKIFMQSGLRYKGVVGFLVLISKNACFYNF